ncbi:centromere binding protein b [Moniliophthora roreri MCA 2997]|uniref:Centromere binding protein b n=2 Tax=Moniliophthora roreri TaxID=221103 RepID=V2XQ01_MONRO|nr:centromere binding protein b [Moniliophthora roreri MCA 2997]
MPGSSSASNPTTTTTYPLTPDESSYSPYPACLAHGHHSRSNSNSVSNGRSASPALSTITTSSHSSSANNTQNHSALLSPFVRNAYSPVAASPPGIADLPAASPVAIRPKQRKQRLFNVDRQAICQYHLANPTARQEDIAARYGVERSTISKILKHKAKWLNVCPEEGLRVAKHRPSKFPEIESSMLSWLHSLHSTAIQGNGNSPNFPKKSPLLSDTRLREKALSLAKEFQIPEDKFKASSGWVENFKHRHGIRNGIWEGAGRSKAIARALGIGAEGRLDQDRAEMDPEPYGDDPETPSEYGGSQRVLRHDSQHVNDLPPQRPGFRRSWTEPSVRVDGVEMSHSSETVHHNYQHQNPRYPSQEGYPPPSQAYEGIPHSSSSSGSDPQGHSSYGHSISHSSSASASHVYQPPVMPPPINTNVAPSHSLQQPTPIDSHPNSFGSASSDHSHSHGESISAHVHRLDDESRPPISPSGRRMVPTIPELPPGINVPPLPPPVLRLPDNSPPSLEDAERSLDRVILFVNTLPPGQEILTQEQKDQLLEIKCVLFKAGAGIPFR